MALTKITPQMFDTSAAGHDFNIDNGTFVVDASANRVGIGTATPSTLLHVDGTATATTFVGALTGNVTGNVSGTAATVTGAAQTNITSVGTLSALTISGNLTVDTNTLTVDATNNRVGIGTASPSHALDVTGEVRFNSNIRLTETSSSAETGSINLADSGLMQIQAFATNGEIAFDTGPAAAERMRIDSSGNVGIGEPNPDQNLVVKGSTDSQIKIVSGGSNDAYLTFYNGTSLKHYFKQDNTGLFELYYYDGSTANSRVAVNTSGNVGIGTASPRRQIHLHNAASATTKLMITNGATGESNDGQGFQLGIDSSGNALVENRENTNLTFYTNNSPRMTVLAGGNVGIGGVTNPAAPLEVKKGVSGNYVARFENSNASTPYGVWIKDAASSSAGYPLINISNNDGSDTHFRVDSSTGKVMIGTAAGDGTLHVHTASAGTVAASSQADDLVIENNAEGGMTIITPDDQSARIRFTSPSTNTAVGGASIFYRQNINKMNIGTEVSGGILALHSGAGSETMRLDGSGNVGIGNPSPSNYYSTFDDLVIGSSSSHGITVVSGTSGAGTLSFADGTSGDAAYRGYIQYNHSNDKLVLGSAGNDRLHIDSSGRVGIGGTPNSNWRNDMTDKVITLGTEAAVFADTGITTELWNNAYVNNSDQFYNISTRGASRYRQYSGKHEWWTAASASAGSNVNTEIHTTPKMVLDISGKLGIGHDTPAGSLHVRTKDVNGADVAVVAQNTTNNRIAGFHVQDEGGAARLKMQYDNGSNLASLINDSPAACNFNILTTAPRNTYVALNYVAHIAESFNLAGNVTYNFEYTVPNEGGYGNSFFIIAGFNHFHSASYGAHRVAFVSTRGTSLSVHSSVLNQTSGYGGQWLFTKPNATTLRIQKLAGTYSGSGSGFIQVFFRNAIG